MATTGIKDIAALAGVSTATVSNTMRNPHRVSTATREKVMSAIEKTGYVPNKLGASLRTSRTNTILTIIPDITNNFNSGIIKAIEKVAHEHGYSVLLGDTQDSHTRELEYGAMARSQHADGIIFLSHRLPFPQGQDRPTLQDLPPMVNSCEYAGIDGIPLVSIDNLQAGIDATRHLIEFGHRDIAVITGDMEYPSSQQRLDGYRQAMHGANLPVKEDYIAFADFSAESGEQATHRLLALEEPPSAIFCFSDEIALGCIHTLHNAGLIVPQDISVMGFDDIRFAKYMPVPLTTIAQPTDKIGEHCARLLIQLMAGEDTQTRQLTLPHELIIRKSTDRLSIIRGQS